MVAAAHARRHLAAGGALRPGDPGRLALRQAQPASAGDARPRLRFFPVRQRLLGAAATCGAPADMRRPGPLRRVARSHRCQRGRGRVFAAASQSQIGRRPAFRRRRDWPSRRHGPLRPCPGAGHCARRQRDRRGVMDRRSSDTERLGTGGAARLGAGARTGALYHCVLRLPDDRQRGLGRDRGPRRACQCEFFLRPPAPSRQLR